MKVFNKYWLHVVIWIAMALYFLFAPDLFLRVFVQAGKPLQTDAVIPVESDRITFVVEELGSYIQGGESLYNLYGWAFIIPKPGQQAESYIREIILASDKKVYSFPVKSEYRNPGTQSFFTDLAVDLNTLGFNTLIAEDAIRPGKYRVGIIFKNSSTGSAYYWDKPAHYLIKTPNRLTFK
jgi:hypothetical protein